MTKEYQGGVRFAYLDGPAVDGIEITVSDGNSGIEFLTIKLGYAEFARALGGGECDATFSTWGIDRIGWHSQSKTERVYFPSGKKLLRAGDIEVREILALFEVEGWSVRSGDIGNMHRRGMEGSRLFYTCVFFRLVPPCEDCGAAMEYDPGEDEDRQAPGSAPQWHCACGYSQPVEAGDL